MAIENVHVVKIDTGDAQRNTKELKAELKSLKDTMLSCEQGTDEYNKALRRAAEITHTLKEQTEEINASAMDFGQIASNCTKTVGGMVAGFQAAKATLSLFGVENETVIKSLQRMQNLMAITQALPSLDNGVKAFKRLSLAIKGATGATHGLKSAIVSTGLGAIVVGLGMLVAHFEDIVKWLEKITGQTDLLGKISDAVVGGLNAGWAAVKQTMIGVGKAIVTYVVAPFKSVWSAIQAYTSTEGGFADKLKAAGKAMKSEFVDEWKDVGSEFKKIGEVTAAAYYEGYDKHKAKRLAETEEERKARLKAEEEYAKQIAEIRKKYEELNDKVSLYGATELEKRLAEIKKALDKEVALLDEALKKKIISQEQYEKDRKAIEDHYAKEREKAQKEALKKEQEERIKTSIDLIDTSHKLELAKLQSQYNEKLISEKEFNDRKKELQTNYVQDYIDNIKFLLETEDGLTDEQILSLTEKMNAVRASLKETDKEDSVETKLANMLISASEAINVFADNPAWSKVINNISQIATIFDDLNKNHIEKGSKEAFKSYTQVASVAFAAIGTMLQGLASEQDTSNKEGFEQSKKYQIAAATMQMFSGIAMALSGVFTTKTGPWDIALAAVQAGLIGAMGAMQIAKIKQTQFNGGGSTSAGATPNTGAINSIIAPVQYTQDVQGASIESAIKDNKVYVVESDITNTQNKVSVTENEALY